MFRFRKKIKPLPNSHPFFIFDFDGTIADTHQYIVNISNQLAKDFNYDMILPQDVERYKDHSAKEMIHILNVPLMKIPAIISKAKKELQKGMLLVQPIKGLKEALTEMKKRECKMGILSSNSQENIEIFLKNHKLDFFDFIHSTSKVWSKDTTLRKIITKYQIQVADTFYIGDETRDITAAKKMGAKMIAVSWGYNSKKALNKHRPDYLIDHPEELLKFTTPKK